MQPSRFRDFILASIKEQIASIAQREAVGCRDAGGLTRINALFKIGLVFDPQFQGGSVVFAQIEPLALIPTIWFLFLSVLIEPL